MINHSIKIRKSIKERCKVNHNRKVQARERYENKIIIVLLLRFISIC